MKARDIAQNLRREPTLDSLTRALYELVLESHSIIQQRNARSDMAVRSVFSELEDKWRAVVRLCPDLKISLEDGDFISLKDRMFSDAARRLLPEVSGDLFPTRG